jgi:DNA repair protein RecO
MYYCDEGIVLRHRNYNEYDRLVTVFTRDNGRIEINFKGVSKSHSKLKALTELFCHCDYRLYQRKYGAISLCIGGTVISSFPSIRNDFRKLMIAQFVSDIMLAITPLNHPLKDKYNFLLNSLRYINNNLEINRWFEIIFMMNILEFYGIGFKETNVGYDRDLWSYIHTQDIERLDFNLLEKYGKYYDSLFEFALNKIKEHADRDIVYPFNYSNVCI